MGQFYLHFFKEKSRKIDLESLISFFNNLDSFEIEMTEEHAKFKYTHPTLGYKANFIITPKSQVPHIYRLNPRFLDLNFRVEFPILTPDYVAKEILTVAKKICDRYNFYVYSEFFEDVLAFKMDIVTKVFSMIKHEYIKRNDDLQKQYAMLPSETLSNVLRYTSDIYELQMFYRDKKTLVPAYQVFRNRFDVILTVEVNEGDLVVFPPNLNFIVYQMVKSTKVIDFNQVLPMIAKYLDDVPGFIKGTKVITKKNLKKLNKFFKKYDSTINLEKYQRIAITSLLD